MEQRNGDHRPATEVMAEIEKDLVRWRRGQWIAVTAIVFALQLGLIVGGSQKGITVREDYPSEPRVALQERFASEWAGWLEDPFLFASASGNGFSAMAWLQTPAWTAPETGRPVPVRYLNLTEAEKITDGATANPPFAFADRTKPGPVFPAPKERVALPGESSLRMEGLEGRALMNPPELPVQYHNDVLLPTVVETLVGPDGLVVSAVVIENSGSPKADAEALAAARATRFSPKSGPKGAPEVGKLIFEWIALDLSQTNGVGTNNVRSTR